MMRITVEVETRFQHKLLSAIWDFARATGATIALNVSVQGTAEGEQFEKVTPAREPDPGRPTERFRIT